MSVDTHGDYRPRAGGEPALDFAAHSPSRAGRIRSAVEARLSSSLTRRIVVLNLGGLVVLALAFLYLNQFREGLIDARAQSLRTQGEIIAAAVAASATAETDAITIDPEKLLQLAPGESWGPLDGVDGSLEFSINPERVGPVLRRLVSPTRTRARVYDHDGYLLVDSQSINARSNILRYDLPSANQEETSPTLVERTWNMFRGRFGPTNPRPAEEVSAGNGRAFPEVREALGGAPSTVVRVNARGETIISVAVPVQRFRMVRGALLLSTQGDDIDKIIASERSAILRIFAVSAGVMFLLSLFLAGTIAEPIRRLAYAAERVRGGAKSRLDIPDFTSRSDEIGHLSGALRDMTRSLYNRIEGTERFAADVAHELKNPLTSLRSAVETLPRAKTDNSRERLLEIIQHDVRRLDRLISDISDASRLDAELARADMQPIDASRLVAAVVEMANNVDRGDGVHISVDVSPSPDGFRVTGHDSRLAQVVNNLLDNARSFSERGGSVRVAVRRGRQAGAADNSPNGVEIIVDDDGPGIPDHAFERIFERFYTDRPEAGFGQNSGLGLSISRQIIEAHGGTIKARNRPGSTDDPDDIAGARFTVWLPAAA